MLNDRVAIITGSGRGLGTAYARLLAERGARVVIHDAGVNKEGTGFDPNVAVDVAKKICEAGGVAIANLLNVRLTNDSSRYSHPFKWPR